MTFKHPLYRKLSFSWLALLILTPAYAQSSEIVAQVVWTQGQVLVRHIDNTTETLSRRSPLHKGESIETGKDGTGQIIFTDQTTVALAANTILKINDYLFDKTKPKKDEKYLVNLAKGGCRTVTGLIAKDNPDNYKIKTPVATIGVGGTVVDTSHNDKTRETTTRVIEGGVNVTNLQNETYHISPGAHSTVVVNRTTTAYTNRTISDLNKIPSLRPTSGLFSSPAERADTRERKRDCGNIQVRMR